MVWKPITIFPDKDGKPDLLGFLRELNRKLEQAFLNFNTVRKTTLEIGTGKDEDIEIIAQNGDANQPRLRYNKTTNKWQYSNNGVDFTDM
jgi:hypothetical protein